jgi:hypothetical protein
VFQEFTMAYVQTWIAADGSGRQVTSEDLNPLFATRADESAWARSGGKRREPPRYHVNALVFGPGGVDRTGNPIPENRPQPINVSSLPTNPEKLAKALCTQRWHSLLNFGNGLAINLFNVPGSTPPCQLFDIALVVLQGSILQGQIIGSTPQLREALFHVLARVPGVQLLGMRDDGAGTKGIALRLTVHERATSYTETCPALATPPIPARVVDVHVPATTTIDTVIIDQASARLLSREQSFLPLKVPVAAFGDCLVEPKTVPPQTFSQLPVRTIVLSTGIVNSTHAVAEGSVPICVLKKGPTRPSYACRGARDDTSS